jgi:hypothetical protein
VLCLQELPLLQALRQRRGDVRRLQTIGIPLSACVKYWVIIADNLSKAGWSWSCVSALDCELRTIWIVDAHRDNGKRFVVRADEKLTAFVEPQANGRRAWAHQRDKARFG